MKKNHLNQTQFANLIGVTRQAVCIGIRKGYIQRESDGGIDPNNELNKSYMNNSRMTSKRKAREAQTTLFPMPPPEPAEVYEEQPSTTQQEKIEAALQQVKRNIEDLPVNQYDNLTELNRTAKRYEIELKKVRLANERLNHNVLTKDLYPAHLVKKGMSLLSSHLHATFGLFDEKNGEDLFALAQNGDKTKFLNTIRDQINDCLKSTIKTTSTVLKTMAR